MSKKKKRIYNNEQEKYKDYIPISLHLPFFGSFPRTEKTF
jgi:hypothetical protein